MSVNGNQNRNANSKRDLTLGTMKNLHYMEDKVMSMPGLYVMWTLLYAGSVVCLATDTENTMGRDYLMITGGLSCLYNAVSGVTLVYGNKLPSSMMLITNPLFLYLYWQLLAYYRGCVYGMTPAGVMNAVNTCVMGVFTVDMLIKSWLYSAYPNSYELYVMDAKRNN